MADVKLTYKGSTIAEMSESGTKTIKTQGKYCEGDIGVEYTKSGGAAYEFTYRHPHADADGKWVCPTDWDNPNNVDRSGQQVLYLVFRTDVLSWVNFRCGFNYKVTKGHIVNDVFVATGDATLVNANTNYTELPIESDYSTSGKNTVTYKVEPQNGNFTGISWYNTTYRGVTLTYADVPLVAIYGRLPNANSILNGTGKYIESHDISDISKITSFNSYFGGVNLVRFRKEGWDFSNVTNLRRMFYGAFNLSDFDLDWSNVVTSKCVTNAIEGTFQNMYALKGEIDCTGWDTSNCTTVSTTFDSCFNLTKIKGLDDFKFPMATTLLNMFANCRSLEGKIDCSEWGTTSALTNTSNMCSNCYRLSEVDISGMDFTNVTTMNSMFAYDYSLEKVTMRNVAPNNAKLTDARSIFYYCYNLKEVETDGGLFTGWNMSACVYLSTIFQNCYSINHIDLGVPTAIYPTVQTSNNATSITTNAYSCEYLDLSMIDIANWNNTGIMTSMIQNMYGLVDFYPPYNINQPCNFSASPMLSEASIQRIVDNLVTPRGATTALQTLNFGAPNSAKLTAEQIDYITELGWIISPMPSNTMSLRPDVEPIDGEVEEETP